MMHWKSLILIRRIDGKNDKVKVPVRLEAGNDKKNKRWELLRSTLLKDLMLWLYSPLLDLGRYFNFLILCSQ
jgi:hypothetical protein